MIIETGTFDLQSELAGWRPRRAVVESETICWQNSLPLKQSFIHSGFQLIG